MAAERFPIEAGHVMMFARAIGDPNPVYYDPDQAIAPPTFVQASAGAAAGAAGPACTPSSTTSTTGR